MRVSPWTRAGAFAAVCVAGILACGEPPNPPPPPAGNASATTADSSNLAVAARLEQSVWNQSPPPYTTEKHWALMRRVYDGAHYAPLWFSGGAPTAAGRRLIVALCEALDEGIHPAAFAADSGAWDTTAAAGRAASDLRLSAALLELVASRTRGQVAPGTVAPEWRAPPPAEPDDSLLAAWLREPSSTGRPTGLPQPPAYLAQAFARFHRTALAGGWELPDTVGTLRPGVRDSAVVSLRRRLIRSGDLPPADSAGTTYDAAVAAAVRRAQGRLGLHADGVAGPATWSALAVPAMNRARRIAANLERYRWLPTAPAGAALVIDAAARTVTLRVGRELAFDAPGELTVRCLATLPPILADTIRAVKRRGSGFELELAGGRSLWWSAAADSGCVEVEGLSRLASALDRTVPVILYLVAPTVQADADGRIRFHTDPSGSDERLDAALEPVLSRSTPPVCGPVSPSSGPPPAGTRDSASRPRPPAPGRAGTGSARRAD
jgi:murein L,D-transpeptidase YcbB/YkuD